MNTCKVDVEIWVGGNIVKAKTWPACDIMKTGVTRGWATRQFNLFLKIAGKDESVRIEWVARYGKSQGYGSVSGWVSGNNGKTICRRGIFED